MPLAAKHPCTFPGCSALIEAGQGSRCERHATRRPELAQQRRLSDRYRGSAASRGYDSRWQAFRPHWFARNPLCTGVLMATSAWTAELAEQFHRLREAAREEESRLLLFAGIGRTRARRLPELCVYQPMAAFLTSHRIYDWAAWDVGQPGAVIDHIKPHRGDPVLFWAEWNLQTLTTCAHDKKTARERAIEKRISP